MIRRRKILYPAVQEAAPQPPVVTVSVTFTESFAVVPYRRAFIYRSTFEAPVQPVTMASGALSVSGATSAAFAGAATAEAVLSIAGNTTASFVAQVPAVVTFAESWVIVPCRRAMIYPSIFSPGIFQSISAAALSEAGSTAAAFAGAAIGAGVFATAGATALSFASNVIVTVFLAESKVELPQRRRRRGAAYQSVFEPPFIVPITVSGAFSTTGATSVAFIESALFAGALSVSGSTTPAFIGAVTGAGVLSVSGGTNAAFVGAAIGAGAFAVAGSTAPNFVSNVIVSVLYSESSVVIPTRRVRRAGAYQSIFEPPLTVPLTRSGVLSVSGSTAAAFIGASVASGVLAVANATAPAFVGRSTAAGVLSITGSTTAAFVGPIFQAGALAVAGSTTAAFTGRAIVAAAFSTAGSTTVAAVGLELKTVAGVLATVGASEIVFSTTPIRPTTGRRTRVRPVMFSRPDQVMARRPANVSTGKRRPSWG